MKHSGVRRFEVQLRSSNGQLHLHVRDPGTGFDVADARRGRGLGLLSMEERIQMVNGQIAIESQPWPRHVDSRPRPDRRLIRPRGRPAPR
jgi:signal transduction histidine kinase